MKIGIAFDLAPADPALPREGPDDRFEEFDKPETVEAIAEVIRGEGHDVTLLGDGRDFLARVLADPPDFVFNIAEGEGVGRCREARVPAVLEMLGIPYSGSDPLTLSVCLNKSMAKRLVQGPSFLAVPRGWSFEPNDHVSAEGLFAYLFDRSSEFHRRDPSRWPFALILKPEFEGSSKGIRGKGIVEDLEAATETFRLLARDYDQPILVEEFIDGEEWTVGFSGTDCLIGTMRIMPIQREEKFVYSLDVKRDWRNRVTYEAPPLAPESTIEAVISAAVWVYRTLGCRDHARIDFRVRDGHPYFIEANPLPGLAPVTSDLVILAEGHELGYPDLIRKIFQSSLARVKLL